MPLILENLPPLHWAVAGAGMFRRREGDRLQRAFRLPPLVVGTGQG